MNHNNITCEESCCFECFYKWCLKENLREFEEECTDEYYKEENIQENMLRMSPQHKKKKLIPVKKSNRRTPIPYKRDKRELIY
jgi:hypothetical protein